MDPGIPSKQKESGCLGPFLFLAYINDIDSCFSNSSVLKYADNIQCYKAFPKNDHNSYLLLQNDLDSLFQWSNTWQLQCTSIHFGHGNKQHQHSILNQNLSLSDVEKDLDVLIRSDLKSSSHISAIVQKAEKCLAVLKRNIVSRNKEVYLKLYKQIDRPHLEMLCIPGIHILLETLNLLKGFNTELQNVLKGCSLKVMLTA